jgi:hypothetical protein
MTTGTRGEIKADNAAAAEVATRILVGVIKRLI